MKLYHYSTHEFAVGDIVEARISFPYPEAWAWATSSPSSLSAFGNAGKYEVEPLNADLELSPHHPDAYRSPSGFKVVAVLDKPKNAPVE